MNMNVPLWFWPVISIEALLLFIIVHRLLRERRRSIDMSRWPGRTNRTNREELFLRIACAIFVLVILLTILLQLYLQLWRL